MTLWRRIFYVMKINNRTKNLILKGIERKGWSKAEFARSIKKSRGWASKLLKDEHEIAELSDDLVNEINDKLGIVLRPIVTLKGTISPTCLRLSTLSENDPDLAGVLEGLLTLTERANGVSVSLDEIAVATVQELEEGSPVSS